MSSCDVSFGDRETGCWSEMSGPGRRPKFRPEDHTSYLPHLPLADPSTYIVALRKRGIQSVIASFMFRDIDKRGVSFGFDKLSGEASEGSGAEIRLPPTAAGRSCASQKFLKGQASWSKAGVVLGGS